MALWHIILHWTGIDNVSGPQYGFWSGFGSDLGELAIITIVYRKINCHAPGCWRLALHHVSGTPYVTCRKHHPLLAGSRRSLEHIQLMHDKSKGGPK